MFNAASRVGAGVYGNRQKSVKMVFKILFASADTSKIPRLFDQSDLRCLRLQRFNPDASFFERRKRNGK